LIYHILKDPAQNQEGVPGRSCGAFRGMTAFVCATAANFGSLSTTLLPPTNDIPPSNTSVLLSFPEIERWLPYYPLPGGAERIGHAISVERANSQSVTAEAGPGRMRTEI